MSDLELPLVSTADMPIIYADDVASLSSSTGVLKFYLTRNDSAAAPEAKESTGRRVVAQVIMPKVKLIEMAFFLLQSLRELESEGALYDDAVISERLKMLNDLAAGGTRGE